MAVDKNKIIAEATKLIQKGAYDKAIAAYQKILAHDPKEVRSLLKVAELYQKKGDDKAAARSFEKVAETYAEQGFFLKAVAVYKQIVKIDPDDVRVNERLAALYQQLGLMSDAMSQYQLMAAAYEKAGDGAKLVDVLKRMLEIDPENIASSIKLGELYARSNQPQPALECFGRAAEYLKKHNRAEEYLKVAERISSLLPGDLNLTRELANIYLAKRDTKRALAKLQLCFKADPKDVLTLQLLAQAFKDLGQITKTISVYKELAHIHQEHGRVEEARSVWRKVQELAPGDEEAAVGTGSVAPPTAAATEGRAPGAARALAGAARAPGTPSPADSSSSPPPLPPSGPDAIPKLLSETDVYVKYGLHDKALDHLKRVLAIDPRSPEAHERAREIHLAAGRPEEAGRSAALTVRAFLEHGQVERAREAMARLRQIAPDHPEMRELNAAVVGTEEVHLGEGEAEVDEELILDAEDVAQADVDDDSLALAAAAQQDESIEEDASEPGETPWEEAPDEDEEALEAARASAEAEEEIVEEEAPAPPARPPASLRSGPAASAGAPPIRPASSNRPASPAAAHPPDEEEHADLSDEIEEADFFVQQGLFEEAREALQNLRALYPDHPDVKAKLAEVERRAHSAAPAATASAGVEDSHAVGDGSFDIARELADELGPSDGTSIEEEFQYSVDEVFDQFKKGVEQTVKKEDSATHYDLGIAYKEMALLDDAIHEFETALNGNDRRKEVDCLAMIGLCRMAKGEPREAVNAFRRALASDYLNKDATKAIHYDLATAYEEATDREAALYYFQRVVKADPGFRDAKGRIASLGGGPGRPPPEVRSAAAAVPRPAIPPRPPAPSLAPARPSSPSSGAPKKNIGYL